MKSVVLALRMFRIIVPLAALCLLGLALFSPRLLNEDVLFPIVILTGFLGYWLRSRAGEIPKSGSRE